MPASFISDPDFQSEMGQWRSKADATSRALQEARSEVGGPGQSMITLYLVPCTFVTIETYDLSSCSYITSL